MKRFPGKPVPVMAVTVRRVLEFRKKVVVEVIVLSYGLLCSTAYFSYVALFQNQWSVARNANLDVVIPLILYTLSDALDVRKPFIILSFASLVVFAIGGLVYWAFPSPTLSFIAVNSFLEMELCCFMAIAHVIDASDGSPTFRVGILYTIYVFYSYTLGLYRPMFWPLSSLLVCAVLAVLGIVYVVFQLEEGSPSLKVDWNLGRSVQRVVSVSKRDALFVFMLVVLNLFNQQLTTVQNGYYMSRQATFWSQSLITLSTINLFIILLFIFLIAKILKIDDEVVLLFLFVCKILELFIFYLAMSSEHWMHLSFILQFTNHLLKICPMVVLGGSIAPEHAAKITFLLNLATSLIQHFFGDGYEVVASFAEDSEVALIVYPCVYVLFYTLCLLITIEKWMVTRGARW